MAEQEKADAAFSLLYLYQEGKGVPQAYPPAKLPEGCRSTLYWRRGKVTRRGRVLTELIKVNDQV